MKNSLTLWAVVCCCLLPNLSEARSDSIPEASSLPEIHFAACPLDQEELAAYFQQHLQYPELARDYHVEGIVVLAFKVLENGCIGEIKVRRSMGFGLDEEAKRLVRLLPPWQPARYNGTAFPSLVRMPIAFSLP